jgi:F-type H+-transporting ATPase subunit b
MDINIIQILFQIVNFSVVVGAVSYLLYKPVLKILEERTNRIEEAQNAAKKTIEEKERLSAYEKEVILEAEKKASEIVDEARKAEKRTKLEAVESAKKQAALEIEKSKQSWETEKSQLKKEIRIEYINSVIATTKKILAVDLDSKKHAQLIDSQLADLLKKI